MSALTDWDRLGDRYYRHDTLGALEHDYSGTESRFGWYRYPVVERGAVRIGIGPYDRPEEAAEAAAGRGSGDR